MSDADFLSLLSDLSVGAPNEICDLELVPAAEAVPAEAEVLVPAVVDAAPGIVVPRGADFIRGNGRFSAPSEKEQGRTPRDCLHDGRCARAKLTKRVNIAARATADAAIDLVQKNVETQSTGSQHSFEHGVLVADLLKGRPRPRSGSAF